MPDEKRNNNNEQNNSVPDWLKEEGQQNGASDQAAASEPQNFNGAGQNNDLNTGQAGPASTNQGGTAPSPDEIIDFDKINDGDALGQDSMMQGASQGQQSQKPSSDGFVDLDKGTDVVFDAPQKGFDTSTDAMPSSSQPQPQQESNSTTEAQGPDLEQASDFIPESAQKNQVKPVGQENAASDFTVPNSLDQPEDLNTLNTNDQSDVSTQAAPAPEPDDVSSANPMTPAPGKPDSRKRFKAVRTYRDYAAEKLKDGGASLTQMILSEREKERERERNSAKNSKNIVIIILSMLLVLAGIAAIIGVFFYVAQLQERQERVNTVLVPPDPIVFVDFKKEVYLAEPDRRDIVREVETAIEETSIPVGLIRQLVLTQDNERKTAKVLTTSADLLEAIEADVDPRFYRTARDQFLMGIYSSTNNSPFMVFNVDSYSTAYADMLAWEGTMGSNLAPVFGLDPQAFTRANFNDIVLYNKDVRAVLDPSGEVLFGYSFVDQETLVIFENRLALQELVSRLQNNRLRE